MYLFTFTLCCFIQQPVLPVELEICSDARNADQSLDTDAILSYAAKITALKDAIYKKAKINIDKAQEEYKKYYNKKYGDIRVNDNNRLCCLLCLSE